MSYGAFYSLYGFVCLDFAVGNGSYKFVTSLMWSLLVLFLRKKWDARRQAYRALFGEIYQQKISGVMHLKRYPWVVNLFLCGRVWQLYGS
jgi:hypothetical protein